MTNKSAKFVLFNGRISALVRRIRRKLPIFNLRFLNGVASLTPEMEQLKSLSSPEEFEAGLEIYRRDGVRRLDENQEVLRFVVDGDPRRLVRVGVGHRISGRCSCETFIKERKPCRHLVAAMLLARGSGCVEEAQRKHATAAANEMLKAIELSLPMEAQLKLEITLTSQVDDQGQRGLYVSLRVGQERLYVVRHMGQFLSDLTARKDIVFGKGFTLHSQWMAFSGVDEKIIALLDEALVVRDMSAQPDAKIEDGKLLAITQLHASRLMRLLMARPFKLVWDNLEAQTIVIDSGPIQLYFEVQIYAREVRIIAQMPDSIAQITPDCEFAYVNGDIIKTIPVQRPVLSVLLKSAQQGRVLLHFSNAQTQKVLSELLPRLEEAGEVKLSNALAERIVRKPLVSRVYIDKEAGDVVARTIFLYGDEQIDPFSVQVQDNSANAENLLLVRDSAKERRVLDQLASSGFRVRSGSVYLSKTDAIYRFLTEGVDDLREVAQVFCSESFRKMTPRKPNFSGVLRMTGNKLQLQLLDDGENVDSLLEILEALRMRKKYFHLKNGTFLDLSSLEEWTELAEAASDAKKADADDGEGVIDIAAYRVAYLNSMLEESQIPVATDESVRDVVSSLGEDGDSCPEALDAILRPYQKRGFSWMQALYKLKMGGVLADDMGLGKTLQIIALFLWAKENLEHRPSIVVAPTSLVYNWQSELKRFAPQIRVIVAEGAQSVRAAQIEQLKEGGEVDVFITSYPLIRRDAQLLSSISFRFAVLDEAQYIKNAMSVGAVAVKQLKSEMRLALTGTPMENHPGELWSIFDFVLPGYLHSYAQFMHRFGEGQNSAILRGRIRPFLLRRLKSEVLRELPDKVEMQMVAEMTPEQQRVYKASLLRLRTHVNDLLQVKGVRRGQIEVLSAITELRQICGHPALCLNDYTASSGKLDMLLDVVPGALEAGHRVLLFSQFTRMLRIIKRRLEAEGVTCLYLDGETPPKRRLEMVDRFNAGEGQVFLISLKAGGSGLNLTGADTVIHYDPWWNPAAEDQATDRAHRIGQKKVVQVIRMVTHGTIEEQVVKLGERKRQLFDTLITSGEKMPTQLSETDIKALFEDIL